MRRRSAELILRRAVVVKAPVAIATKSGERDLDRDRDTTHNSDPRKHPTQPQAGSAPYYFSSTPPSGIALLLLLLPSPRDGEEGP